MSTKVAFRIQKMRVYTWSFHSKISGEESIIFTILFVLWIFAISSTFSSNHIICDIFDTLFQYDPFNPNFPEFNAVATMENHDLTTNINGIWMEQTWCANWYKWPNIIELYVLPQRTRRSTDCWLKWNKHGVRHKLVFWKMAK